MNNVEKKKKKKYKAKGQKVPKYVRKPLLDISLQKKTVEKV